MREHDARFDRIEQEVKGFRTGMPKIVGDTMRESCASGESILDAVAAGTHKRVVVSVARFDERVQRKLGGR